MAQEVAVVPIAPGRAAGAPSVAIASTADDNYIATNGRPVTLILEASTADATTGTEVTVSTGTGPAAHEQEQHYWDSDYDGADDTAVLTGVSWPAQKRRVTIYGAPYVLAETTAFGKAAKLSYCFGE